MSAMGSDVGIRRRPSPAGFGHARDLTRKRQFAEADPAQPKLSKIAARPAALLAAVPVTRRKFWLLFIFRDFRGCRH
jgi:hypothetical protein